MEKDDKKCLIYRIDRSIKFSDGCQITRDQIQKASQIVSKERRKEHFMIQCVLPNTNIVRELHYGATGDATSVNPWTLGSVCEPNLEQESFHPHQESGLEWFSESDGKVLVNRFNQQFDKRHHVSGEKGFSTLNYSHTDYSSSPLDLQIKKIIDRFISEQETKN